MSIVLTHGGEWIELEAEQWLIFLFCKLLIRLKFFFLQYVLVYFFLLWGKRGNNRGRALNFYCKKESSSFLFSALRQKKRVRGRKDTSGVSNWPQPILCRAELALVFRVERILGDALLPWGCILNSLMQSWSWSLDIARLCIFSLLKSAPLALAEL